ncbi:MAG: catechol 2,3-dioxygenase-like lactoylglutathione lyase family enzyme [Candidatus Poriferisodalaceae bacterium]|jgi:catechol 2,3-dioxygenase-like lactoylglutathione lyase family enzyme
MWLNDARRRGESVTRLEDAEEMDRSNEWERLRKAHLVAKETRPVSSANGVHHLALLCSDVAQTITFYQDVLEFPLTELFENRDYKGSTHFFFDIGNGNALAFFDFPGLDLGPYLEVLGSMHHLAISVAPDTHLHLKSKLKAAGVKIVFEHGNSFYFNGPDGERLELLAEPLGQMNGRAVL